LIFHLLFITCVQIMIMTCSCMTCHRELKKELIYQCWKVTQRSWSTKAAAQAPICCRYAGAGHLPGSCWERSAKERARESSAFDSGGPFVLICAQVVRMLYL
jgi:hypothetical protein